MRSIRTSGSARVFLAYPQAIPGVPHLYGSREDNDADGEGAAALGAARNPATWMLDISTPASEDAAGADFAAIYSKSSLAR